MTIAVSIQIQDGVVLATDSCVVHRGRSYFNAEKTIQPIRGLPLAAMIVGDASIGLTSVVNHLRTYGDLAKLRSGPWRLSKTLYTVGGIVADMYRYLQQAMLDGEDTGITTITVLGYSANAALPETWRIVLDRSAPQPPELIWGQPCYGLTWDGERECLDRMLNGLTPGFEAVALSCGLSHRTITKLATRLGDQCATDVVTPRHAAPGCCGPGPVSGGNNRVLHDLRPVL